MKLSSILSTFALLTACSTSILGEEDFYTKYNQPRDARGSKEDYIHFFESPEGKCLSCNLQGFDLREAIKKHAGKQIELFGADCRNTNMSNVEMPKAVLTSGKFDGANFENSNLEHSHSPNADFRGTHMRKTNLSNSVLALANFSSADLRDSNLDDIHAPFATMSNTKMSGSNIKNANFENAYLRFTDLEGATVNQETSFRAAVCVFTNFYNIPNLDAANFKDAILHKCTISSPLSDKIRKQAVSVVGLFLKK